MTIQHHPSDETLAAFAAGTLDEARALVVATHVALCPHCRGAVQMMEAVGGALIKTIAPAAMSDGALADALADADAQTPELLIDVATLTGAARMATGMEIPPFFTDDDTLAADLSRLGAMVQDPLWRLPLWRGYEDALNSRIADLNNNPSYNLAGAVTAALFLNRFVEKAKSWMHLDIPAWIDRPRPGRPLGGEVNAARALYALLADTETRDAA